VAAVEWLLGTHQGAVTEEHLDAYLNEFAFRLSIHQTFHLALIVTLRWTAELIGVT
jgi:hypothetical protein